VSAYLYVGEPLEWEPGDGATAGRCSGCEFIRPLRAGICRQCTRERNEIAGLPPAEEYQPAAEYQEGRLW